MADVKAWLDNIHLPQYYSLLIGAGYTSVHACQTLTEQDLLDIGISLPGHQKHILAHLPATVETGSLYGNIDTVILPKQNIKNDEIITLLPTLKSNTACESISSSNEDEDIYDVPMVKLKISKSDQDESPSQLSQASTVTVPSDSGIANPPVLPPKKRVSNENIDTRLGIVTPTVVEKKFDYTTVLDKSMDSEKNIDELALLSISSDNDGINCSNKRRPVPKPRSSIMKKRPVPVPRLKKQISKSLSEISIPEDPTSNNVTNISKSTDRIVSVNQEMTDNDAYETVVEEASINKVYESNPEIANQEKDNQSMLNHINCPTAEKGIYELEESLQNLPNKNQLPNVDDDSDLSDWAGQCPPKGIERVVLGADSEEDLMSKEESDNLANEQIYHDVKSISLDVEDYTKSHSSYTGVWEMSSGLNKVGKIPVNEVKPIPRFENFSDRNRQSIYAPPPDFPPPPLPEDYKTERNKSNHLLSPTIMNLPLAPPAPNNRVACKLPSPPPVIPPRSTSVKSNPVAPKLPNTRHNHSFLDDDSYSKVDRQKEKLHDLPAGVKRAPLPPPKVDNPFKDFYDESRGTYCFESDTDADFGAVASGWESEDTLSDGGDFLSDDDELGKLNTLDRHFSNIEGSIPITTVQQSRIVDRSGFLYKKSSGKSGGNPIKASTRWQKRWVVYDSIDLKYYSTNKSQISKRIVPANSIINVEQDIRLNETHPYRFTLFTIDRAYTFATESSNDLLLWTSLIMSTILESSTDDFLEGGDMNNPTMKGFVKMEGAKGKRYLAVKGDKFCYYNTYNDYKGGCPIHALEMKLSSVKDVGKQRLQMHTPTASYIFVFDFNDDLLAWKEAFEEAIAEGLGDNSVLSEVYENHSNRFCADCGAPDPHWASINLGITLCKKCAGIHRGLSVPLTKIRSLRMDFKVWTPVLKEMLRLIGNDNSNNFWEWNASDEDKIDSDVDMNVRMDYIIAKYKQMRFVKYHPLKCDQEALNEALCKSAHFEDVVETMQLLFSGADILYSSLKSNDATPLQVATITNQTIQMEFLHQNGAEGSGQIQMVSPQYYRDVDSSVVSRTAIRLKGYIHKTGSNVKGEFLKRWLVLENEILSYYENENKSQAKDSIQRQEMLSVTLTTDDSNKYLLIWLSDTKHYDTNLDNFSKLLELVRIKEPICDGSWNVGHAMVITIGRLEFSFELATAKEHGRTYLFAADSNEERLKWTIALARTIAPIPYTDLEKITSFSKGGIAYIRDGSTSVYKPSWIQVEGRKLVIYNIEMSNFEEIDLRKIKNITLLQSSTQRCSQCLEDGNPFVLDLPERAIYVQGDIRKETEEWFNFIKKSSVCICLGSGGTLSDQQLTNENIPVIIEKCTSHIETHGGLEIEGIYRLSGQHSKVTSLLSSFQKDARSVHISQEYTMHDVGNALKRFIRGLEEPILTSALYDKWLKIAQYKLALEDLPRVHYNTLQKLILHLVKVKEKESLNKMSATNIASIFGPITLNVSQEADNTSQGFASTNKEIAVMKDILENHDYFFVVSTIQRNKEQKFLDAIKKMQEAEKSQVVVQFDTGNVYRKVSIYKVLHLMSSFTTLKTIILQVLAVAMNWSNWPDDFRLDNHLCVKKNFVYDQIGMVSLGSIASWNVEDLTIYIGCQHKRNPPCKWSFTFMKNEELKHFPSQKDVPFFGNTVCCNNQEELYRWIAAMYRAQHPEGLLPGPDLDHTLMEALSSTNQVGLDTVVPANARTGPFGFNKKDKPRTTSILQKMNLKKKK